MDDMAIWKLAREKLAAFERTFGIKLFRIERIAFTDDLYLLEFRSASDRHSKDFSQSIVYRIGGNGFLEAAGMVPVSEDE